MIKEFGGFHIFSVEPNGFNKDQVCEAIAESNREIIRLYKYNERLKKQNENLKKELKRLQEETQIASA